MVYIPDVFSLRKRGGEKERKGDLINRPFENLIFEFDHSSIFGLI